MTLRAWLDHNAKQRTTDPADTVDLPDIMLTESELTEEEWLRFISLLDRTAREDYVVVIHA
jgi:hypothetical protein